MNSEYFLNILTYGQVTLSGQFTFSSNFTFLVTCALEEQTVPAVYKPARGQTPLWDFDAGSLPRRETAAFLLAATIGWEFIPTTVYRQQGLPAGPGSLQKLIDHDPAVNYFNLSHLEMEQLREIVLFDVIANNADRKGGHLLKDPHGKIWAIDHALCFHAQDKLRTVIWDFSEQTITDEELEILEKLAFELVPGGSVCERLGPFLSSEEIAATLQRTNNLLDSKQFPGPNPDRRSFPLPIV